MTTDLQFTKVVSRVLFTVAISKQLNAAPYSTLQPNTCNDPYKSYITCVAAFELQKDIAHSELRDPFA